MEINNRFTRLLFFGNYFYGICAIALSIEASLQQKFPLNNSLFYFLIFSATVLYYSMAYIITEISEDETNIRSRWYAEKHSYMIRSQAFFVFVLTGCSVYFLVLKWQHLLNLPFYHWLLILVFPMVSCLYYGVNSKLVGNINLRNVGWLKPFIIGFTWAGMVTVYPVLFYCIYNGLKYEPGWVSLFLFIKNFMYITLLCIMFDFKDYAMDYNRQLKTFVVHIGLRRTVYYIIIPLCITGLASFLVYAFIHNFHPVKIFLNTIPFILVILVANSMNYKRSIFYYLAIIDGLMLIKAVCGSVAMIYF